MLFAAHFSILICLVVPLLVVGSKIAPNVGIIGGGVGGSASAYFVRELLPKSRITIFERSSILGGRLNVTMVFGNGYETGGSIIHPANKYAVDLAQRFGLGSRTDGGEALSIVKDDEYVFNTSKWTIITIIKSLIRYGFSFNTAKAMTTGFIDKFKRIYDHQTEGKAFKRPEELLESMDPLILNLTRVVFKDLLMEKEFQQNFIDEIIRSITFVNYGQDLGLHGLVGSVSLAGAGSDLWSIMEGNRRLPVNLAEKSGAQIEFNAEITEIARLQDGTYRLLSGSMERGIFDDVIIAIPLDASRHIKFTDFKQDPYPYLPSRKYHRTVATIVAGWPQPEYKFRTDVISCVPHWYTSMSLIHPTILRVAEKYPVYKIFSNQPLTDKQLDSIFAERHFLEVHDWLAYPEYDQVPAPQMPHFILAPRLYYLNAIEWAASAIEMSLISAKNLALLISQDHSTR